MSDARPKLLRRMALRVFPKSPDFFFLLEEQAGMMVHSVRLLLKYMETGDATTAELLKTDEHEADKLKARNPRSLNEAFSTPIDREDIYRAIAHLDPVVNYCKTTVDEMDLLQVRPDAHTLAMVQRLEEGAESIRRGFERLRRHPESARGFADAGRKVERRMEKLYRIALVELFQGDDYLGRYKKREIYRHLSNAGDRLARAANTLHDIVVKAS